MKAQRTKMVGAFFLAPVFGCGMWNATVTPYNGYGTPCEVVPCTDGDQRCFAPLGHDQSQVCLFAATEGEFCELYHYDGANACDPDDGLACVPGEDEFTGVCRPIGSTTFIPGVFSSDEVEFLGSRGDDTCTVSGLVDIIRIANPTGAAAFVTVFIVTEDQDLQLSAVDDGNEFTDGSGGRCLQVDFSSDDCYQDSLFTYSCQETLPVVSAVAVPANGFVDILVSGAYGDVSPGSEYSLQVVGLDGYAPEFPAVTLP